MKTWGDCTRATLSESTPASMQGSTLVRKSGKAAWSASSTWTVHLILNLSCEHRKMWSQGLCRCCYAISPPYKQMPLFPHLNPAHLHPRPANPRIPGSKIVTQVLRLCFSFAVDHTPSKLLPAWTSRCVCRAALSPAQRRVYGREPHYQDVSVVHSAQPCT